MLAALVGDGLIKSAALFMTRLLTLISSVLAAAIAGGEAIVKSRETAPSAGSAPTWIGFSQAQTTAIVIALIGLVAIVVAADLITRAWVTVGCSDRVFLATPWRCALDRAPDIVGTLIALRPGDDMGLFLPNSPAAAQAIWAPLSEVKGRPES